MEPPVSTEIRLLHEDEALVVLHKPAPLPMHPSGRFNRNTLNPWMMRRAGGEHWYASVVKHVGRASGTQYETPVVMLAVDGHLAIPLPYGDDVDWLENLQYAGGGAALHKGAEYVLTDPVIVSRAAIAESLGHRDAFRYRVLGIDEFVKLRAERIVAESAVAV